LASRKIDALNAGATMLFRQASVPTGWTKITTWDNSALRLVSGTPSQKADSGDEFTTLFAARTITSENLPAHSHTFSATTDSQGSHQHYAFRNGTGGNLDLGLTNSQYAWEGVSDSSRSQNYRIVGQANVADVGLTSASGAHTHSISGNTGNGPGTATAMAFDVNYVDLYLASKDA